MDIKPTICSGFVLGSVLFLSACANIQSGGSSVNDDGAERAGKKGLGSIFSLADVAVDIPEIRAVGDIPPPPKHTWTDIKEDVNDNRATGYGLVSIPAMEEYLNKLYTNAKAQANVPEWPGKVYISSDTTINAHSSSAGNIYINIAVLQSADSEDEIYAVITHEFGHIYLNHQAAYRAKLMTGSAVFFGKAAIALATKNIGGASLNAGDALAAVGGIADNVVIPTWQRSVEQQADRFGVTLSMKAGYSYPAGFKTFLERLALIERSYNAKVAVSVKAVAEARAAKEREIQKQSVDVRLSEAMKSSVSNSVDALTSKLGVGNDAALKNHDDAEIREKSLTDEVRALQKGVRAVVHSASWKSIRSSKSVSDVLSHFAMGPKIEELRQSHRLNDAIKLAKTMASGNTEADGTAVITLFNLLHEENRVSLNNQLEVLIRNQNSAQRSWAAQVLAAKWMATANPAQAKLFIEKQFDFFEKSPRTVPDVISFYIESLNSPILAVSLEAPCIASNPRYRKACIDSALTEQERKNMQAFQDARGEAVGNNLADKMGKAFGFGK